MTHLIRTKDWNKQKII